MRYIRLSAVLVLLACGDGEPTAPPTPPTPVATSITLSATSLSFSSLGETSQLTATVKDQNGATMASATVTWATSDAAVATVSSTGLVTSVADGTATITATSGALTGTAAVTIAQTAASVQLSDTVLSFASLGDTASLAATVKDAAGVVMVGATVAWASSDTTVATVSSSDLVTALANGTTTITASSGSVSATASVTVAQIPASLMLSPDSMVFAAPGDTATVIATVKDAGGTVIVNPTLTWASSDTSTVTVGSSGLVTAVASGPAATVTAQAGEGQATVSARVRGSNLAVTVTGDGDPLSDVSVWLTDPPRTNTKKITDSAGTVLFRNLKAGEHTVTLQQLPTELTVTNPKTIQISADQEHDLVFTGSFTPAQITGTAKSWGKPAEGAVVRIEGRDTVEVTVNSAGVFQVDSVLRGDYTLTISNHTGVRFKEATLTQTLQSGANTAEFIGKPDPERWISFASGSEHTCGVTTIGDAYCWGWNHKGQLGDGTTGTDRATPNLVSGGHTWTSVSGGRYHTCGVTTVGDAYCWGSDQYGQLGDGTTTDSSVPVLVSGGHTWASVNGGGGDHTCGMTTVGDAYCWGFNNVGRIGDGTTTDSSVPVLVSGGHTWASVSGDSCGMTTVGDAYCWGSNQYGRIGDGTTTDSSVPVLVSGGHTWASVNGSGMHTCGVTTVGDAYCWGSNQYGQLGDGITTDSNVPVLVSGGHTWASVTNGNDHTCGVTLFNEAYCWGKNAYGQIGDGTTGGGTWTWTPKHNPTVVSGGLTWVSLTNGNDHTCGVTTSDVAYCWGSNSRGELGFGTNTHSAVPVKVGGDW